MANIFGLTIDNNSRCIHYDSLVDVIANKCYFCRKYYACFHCHDELEEHRFMPWPNSDVSKAKVVLCGICQNEMTAKEYKEQTECLNCGHLFNPNCSRHASIYFN